MLVAPNGANNNSQPVWETLEGSYSTSNLTSGTLSGGQGLFECLFYQINNRKPGMNLSVSVPAI